MIQVRRNLFFTGEYQYLRFSENSPEIKECEHDVCNCTKAVTKRPDGKPHQKQQYIYLKEKSKYYDCEVMLASDGVKVTLRWPGVTLTPRLNGESWSQNNHAYFWFNSNDVKNMIQIEITLPGYGNVDCFFGHMYFGNDVDISKFYHGHSRSKIIDLTKIKPEDVWMHFDGFGAEVQCALQECDETKEWIKVYAIQEKIANAARTYDQDFVSDVETIREKAENDDVMIKDAQHLCRWFSIVTKHLRQTEMFRCGDYCYTNSQEKDF